MDEEEDPSEGACWKDVLAEYECDICFEVLVGVHVLGEKKKRTGEERRGEGRREHGRKGRLSLLLLCSFLQVAL